ncbi:MAG: RagB/SusD family nutrient uptake outer membrane protein [Bacteroidales bacterium]|nr:RagB/SusD family nutrient uptake outer membrane protein [Bacteroidales bacterium]
MKKIFTIITALLLLASCAEFTDIKPKGMNMLSTADELELLLNTEFRDFNSSDFGMYQLPGDLLIGIVGPVANLISSPTPTSSSILVTWDEGNVKRLAEATAFDEDYRKLFEFVGKVANPILASVGFATGDEAKLNQIKAEALCLRAWAEFILVNKYAKGYNPATAENDPGIVYLMDDWDISIPPEKWTVKQVYDQIVADCNAAIELNALPAKNVNQMRWSKACPYAIKALALIAMQDFDGAEAAAKESLKVNDAITNYWDPSKSMVLTAYMPPFNTYEVFYRAPFSCEEDIFYTHVEPQFNLLRTPEFESRIEAGHAAMERVPLDIMMFNGNAMMGMGMSMVQLPYPCVFGMGTNRGAGWNTFGLKTTHQYLIVAECEIYKGNYDTAMEYLDAIRAKRIDPSIYVPLKGTVSSKEDAIAHLKQTALGENVFSIYNFIERKRWNQLADMKETLTKTFNLMSGESYTFTLSPDSPLWIFPFPMNARDNNPNLTPNSYKEDDEAVPIS